MCLCSPSSINWYYRRKLGAKQALYATHWPHVRGLEALAGVWLRVTEMEISGLGKILALAYYWQDRAALLVLFGFEC